MALPSAFCRPEDYFKESVSFLQNYQHLYNFANTDVLVNNILDEINIDGIESLDIFEKDFDLPSRSKTNYFLNGFFAKLERLKAVYNDFVEDEQTAIKVDVPLSPKKRHEVVYLVKEVTKMCEECDCETVVDFGSGLGYLDQLIFETTTFKVLGLECNDGHYIGAKRRQRKYHADSLERVKYFKHFISENSNSNIEKYLEEKFGNSGRFCITGLHACADLTIDAINLFLKMADAKCLVIIPCCYHKMKMEGCSKEIFKNFPISSCLKGIFESYKGFEYMRVPFLRLAAQPPCRTEDSLEEAVFNLLARAVLQLYADKHGCKLKRNKRKAVKIKTIDNFPAYIQSATNGFTLCEPFETQEINKIPINFNLEELETIWREISQDLTFKKAGIFILLQNYLQPVIENFILYDRLQYLRENGIENCTYKRIFNEKTSPRCLALFACK